MVVSSGLDLMGGSLLQSLLNRFRLECWRDYALNVPITNKESCFMALKGVFGVCAFFNK